MSTCIFAGTFDPITKGHVSLIKKVLKDQSFFCPSRMFSSSTTVPSDRVRVVPEVVTLTFLNRPFRVLPEEAVLMVLKP